MDSNGKEEKKKTERPAKKKAAGSEKVSGAKPFPEKDKTSKQKKSAGKKNTAGRTKNAGAKSKTEKSPDQKKRIPQKETAGKKEGAGEQKASGNKTGKNTENPEKKISAGSRKNKKKARNPNLRLVKNGDLPVKEEKTEKKPEEKRKIEEKKKTEEKRETGEKEKTGEKRKTGEKEKAGEKKKTGEKRKAKEKKKTGEKEKNGEKEKREEKGETEKKEKRKNENRKKEEKKKPEENKKTKSRKRADKGAYQEKMELGEWFIQNKSLLIIGLMCFSFLALVICIYRYIVTAYEVTTVYVDGNVHYTNEEIMNMVMEGRYGNNSLYLAMKYREKGIEGVPFVEKMDVHILSPNTIRISVYEKALAGYVEYLGRYMYFDRDGTVVESSEKRTSSIPQVTGLKFDYVVLNELLPVENDEIFKRILDITQLLNKYELMADKIYFDSVYNLTLYFDDVRVTLGSNSDIDHKIIRLKGILPELEGKKGTLQMENYTEDTKNITFHRE